MYLDTVSMLLYLFIIIHLFIYLFIGTYMNSAQDFDKRFKIHEPVMLWNFSFYLFIQFFFIYLI